MELTILSGKGGTGKTTIAASLSKLAGQVLRVDCDVDAPNFYLFYEGEDIEDKEFSGSKIARIDKNKCVNCGKCADHCKYDAIQDGRVNELFCEGCGVCDLVCEHDAVSMVDDMNARTFITKSESGMISRAKMEIGSDGSGKLISYLRKNGKRFIKDEKLTISDGSPGIGCSVISSITGTDAALIVCEPTRSGLEDLMRVVTLCQHFGVMTMICINKYDINTEMSMEIERFADKNKIDVVGHIPYDPMVYKLTNQLKSVEDVEDCLASLEIRIMWAKIKNIIF